MSKDNEQREGQVSSNQLEVGFIAEHQFELQLCMTNFTDKDFNTNWF